MRHHIITFFAAVAALVVALAPAAAARESDKKPAPGALAISDEYHLGAGDKLRIEVYKDPQLSQSVQIRPDGKITLPLVGDMEATGLTPLELRDRITTALKDYITNPTVTVIVVEAESAHAYVMGEVAHPGEVSLHGPVTIVQAIAMAGGFKEFANTKEVKVLRQKGSGVQTLHFNYKDMLNGDSTPMLLHSGDTVIVP